MFLNYVLVVISAIAITPFMTSAIKKYSNEERVMMKDFLKDVKFDWKIGIITSVLLVALFYHYGVCLEFFLYSVLSIIMIMEAFVDIRAQILPNSLNFVGFLVGIVYTYYICLQNIMAGMNLLLGMVTGAGIFLLIAAFALIVYRKEGMGLGDVKLMGMLGLYFGCINTIQIFIVSFLVAAIVSIILIATKVKKTTDYIAFGPFIVIAAVFTMFMPAASTMTYLSSVLIR